MKLRQIWLDGEIRLCAETETGLALLESAKTMLEFIRGGEAAAKAVLAELPAARRLASAVTAPAVTGMDKIRCGGHNYRAHIGECGEREPQWPVLFSKFPNALGADGDVVRLDPAWEEYDYEAELVIVMGRRAKSVREEDALSFVFGYT